MAEVKKARLFLRRGTDTDRKLTTLCEGELGYSTDAFRVVVGDGSVAGGRSVGATTFVSAGVDFNTDLSVASAAGIALSGDLAVFPSSNYTNAGGGTSSIDSTHATTVMILTGSNPGTAAHWVNVNNNIPFGNVSMSADDISGDYVSGGVISGPIALSGGNTHIGGVGPSENLILSGTYLSAATLPTNDIVFPVGLTSAAQLTCIDSIYGFGVQTANTSSNIGNTVGYLAATATTASKVISAYAYTSSAWTLAGGSAYGNLSGTVGNADNSTYGEDGTGMNIFTTAGYLGSGGAYADGTGMAPIPATLDDVVWSYSSKCKIAELVYGITEIKKATDKESSSLSWTDIVEFYFSAYYKHYDDSAAFIGYHNHLLNSNQIVHWNGSSISSGKMRAVPNAVQISIPNTYKAADVASQHCLVLHLGFAAAGSIGLQLTGVRLRN